MTANIVYISDAPSAQTMQAINRLLGHCQQLDSIDNLLKEKIDVSAIIIGQSSDYNSDQLLTIIRKSDQYFLAPVFLESVPAKPSLADGNLADMNQSKEIMLAILTYITQLSIKQLNWQAKLLYYLFTRPQTCLTPNSDSNHSSYYYYPLIELFSNQCQTENYLLLLEDLSKRDILSTKKLIAYTFNCPYCQSAQLSFSECCPNCHSINIKMTEFLHCFTCSLVAPQEEFLKSGQVICPKCHHTLRHIGDDYDRPLESGVCLDCGDYYIDSDLHVCCISCHRDYDTDRLSKQKIYQFCLSENGKDKIRHNVFSTHLEIFNEINYVKSEYFHAILDWLINLQNRYDNEYFSIIAMNINIINSNGNNAIYTFAKNMKKILRKTDLLTRINEQTIFLLLPKTDKNELTATLSRIKKDIEENFSQDELIIKTTSFSAKKNSDNKDSATIIISRMLDMLKNGDDDE